MPRIPGEATEQGYEGWIEISSLSQSAAEGKVSGGCIVHITKALDKAGPLLWAATVTGQSQGNVRIDLLEPTALGGSRVLYDLVLAWKR